MTKNKPYISVDRKDWVQCPYCEWKGSIALFKEKCGGCHRNTKWYHQALRNGKGKGYIFIRRSFPFLFASQRVNLEGSLEKGDIVGLLYAIEDAIGEEKKAIRNKLWEIMNGYHDENSQYHQSVKKALRKLNNRKSMLRIIEYLEWPKLEGMLIAAILEETKYNAATIKYLVSRAKNEKIDLVKRRYIKNLLLEDVHSSAEIMTLINELKRVNTG